MAKEQPVVLSISSPNDIIATIPRMLGFVPTNSLVAVCAHGPRGRLGLAMRFGLEFADDETAFMDDIAARVRHEAADAYFIVVYADDGPATDDSDLPYFDIVEGIGDRLWDINRSGYLVVGEQFWSYCPDPDCCPQEPMRLSSDSPGATAMAAAYALKGSGVLPSREAVVNSVAYAGDDAHWDKMTNLIEEAEFRRRFEREGEQRKAVRALISRLCSQASDPHFTVADEDVADLCILCGDVIVRDEVLVRALKPRRRESLIRVLTAVVQRLPPPDDAPLCSVLAWVAYLSGDGAVANVALDRAFASEPDYSLAHLIADSLDRQVAPAMLEEVMRGAARDLKHRSEAG